MGQSDQVKILYSCTPPTKTDVDVVCLLGTSLVNGYASVIDTLEDSVENYYVPVGDQTWFKRYNGSGLQYSVSESVYWIDYNSGKNPVTGFFSLSASFGKIISASYTWPRSLYIYDHAINGTSIIKDEQTITWNPNDDSSHWPYFLLRLHEAINYLILQGKNPRISVVWGSSAVTSIVATDYEDAINDMVASIRTEFEDNNIIFYWSKPSLFGAAAENQAYRDGVDLVTLSDSKVFSYDCNDFPLTGGHFVNYSEVMRGLDLAALLYNKLYNKNRPTCINPSITGTLKAGFDIGFTYTYSGLLTEDQTVVVDTRRLNEGFGTRCEIWVADDNIGTNASYNISLNYGEVWSVSVPMIGKYLQARVWVVAQSGALHGYVVKGSWQGPVIA